MPFSTELPRQFRYRWTDNFLHSALVDAKVGTNVFSIGGHELQVGGARRKPFGIRKPTVEVSCGPLAKIGWPWMSPIVGLWEGFSKVLDLI